MLQDQLKQLENLITLYVIQILSSIKIKAGEERIKPSLIFNLTKKPKNIKAESPIDENRSIRGNLNPTNKPKPPKSSKKPVSFLS